jgi:hypothetical protein
MLSYLQPQLTSESMLALCSTSSDEGNKSTFPNEDDTEGIFNPTSSAIVTASSSARIPYPYPHHHRSPVPFVYGHTPTSGYGFGFGFYDDMSPFTGKNLNKRKKNKVENFI